MRGEEVRWELDFGEGEEIRGDICLGVCAFWMEEWRHPRLRSSLMGRRRR